MAKIGLQYPVYKGASSQGVIAKAIQADVSITVNAVNLSADDAIAETDRSFQTGTITLGLDDLNETAQVELLGHTKDSETTEITANIDDVAPYVGIGFFAVKQVANVKKYRAIWFPKVQFSEPSDTNATKGETVSFNTPTIEGTIFPSDDGDWKLEQTFATIAEAKTYLNGKAGIVVTP